MIHYIILSSPLGCSGKGVLHKNEVFAGWNCSSGTMPTHPLCSAVQNCTQAFHLILFVGRSSLCSFTDKHRRQQSQNTRNVRGRRERWKEKRVCICTVRCFGEAAISKIPSSPHPGGGTVTTSSVHEKLSVSKGVNFAASCPNILV